jgi:hypothetical protein
MQPLAADFYSATVLRADLPAESRQPVRRNFTVGRSRPKAVEVNVCRAWQSSLGRDIQNFTLRKLF